MKILHKTYSMNSRKEKRYLNLFFDWKHTHTHTGPDWGEPKKIFVDVCFDLRQNKLSTPNSMKTHFNINCYFYNGALRVEISNRKKSKMVTSLQRTHAHTHIHPCHRLNFFLVFEKEKKTRWRWNFTTIFENLYCNCIFNTHELMLKLIINFMTMMMMVSSCVYKHTF